MAKILMVDDSALSRRMLRTILEKDGHTLTEAENGLMALERFSLERPDLVTLDMTMKGMHGLQVLEKILELDPLAKVLVASADIQSTTKEMVRQKGGIGFINKPFTEEHVLSAIKQAFEGDES